MKLRQQIQAGRGPWASFSEKCPPQTANVRPRQLIHVEQPIPSAINCPRQGECQSTPESVGTAGIGAVCFPGQDHCTFAYPLCRRCHPGTPRSNPSTLLPPAGIGADLQHPKGGAADTGGGNRRGSFLGAPAQAYSCPSFSCPRARSSVPRPPTPDPRQPSPNPANATDP
jgi:hypothetical protein